MQRENSLLSLTDLSLGTAEGRAARIALLDGKRFAPLEAFRRLIAAQHGATPHFDPLDGGVAARILLLLETPGPRGPAPRFVSSDNPTGTARNIARFLARAEIDRQDLVIWNAVPWIIHAEGARNRAPRRAEIAAGLAWLPGLLDRLPQLHGVVLSGRVAQNAVPLLRSARPGLPFVAMPHPSPTYVNTSPSVAERIVAALAEIRTVCDG